MKTIEDYYKDQSLREFFISDSDIMLESVGSKQDIEQKLKEIEASANAEFIGIKLLDVALVAFVGAAAKKGTEIIMDSPIITAKIEAILAFLKSLTGAQLVAVIGASVVTVAGLGWLVYKLSNIYTKQKNIRALNSVLEDVDIAIAAAKQSRDTKSVKELSVARQDVVKKINSLQLA